MLVHGILTYVCVKTLLQKIYLFGAEGTTQDRGRPRPASAGSSSPAKRAKRSSHEAEEQLTGQGEEEEEGEPQHLAERHSQDGEMAEKDPPSTSKHSTVIAMPLIQLLSEPSRYSCAKTCQGLYWYATLGHTSGTWMLHGTAT